jgi:hypothetical protein
MRKNSVLISEKNTQYLYYKDKPVNPVLEMTLYSENRIGPTNTPCGKKAEFCNVKVGGIYSNYCAF